MKRIVFLCLILTFFGCAATTKICCPPEDVVFMAGTAEYYVPIMIHKDFFNESTRGSSWMSHQEYLEMMRKRSGY